MMIVNRQIYEASSECTFLNGYSCIYLHKQIYIFSPSMLNTLHKQYVVIQKKLLLSFNFCFVLQQTLYKVNYLQKYKAKVVILAHINV